jgi:hypothetical protein
VPCIDYTDVRVYFPMRNKLTKGLDVDTHGALLHHVWPLTPFPRDPLLPGLHGPVNLNFSRPPSHGMTHYDRHDFNYHGLHKTRGGTAIWPRTRGKLVRSFRVYMKDLNFF